MANKLDSNQRLAKSVSRKIESSSKSDDFDYDYEEEQEYEETDNVTEQVMQLYGKEYDYSSLSVAELNIFLQYALNAYKEGNFSALHPDNLPIDLKIKLNSLPIIEEIETSSKKTKEKNNKKEKTEKQYNWNYNFTLPSSEKSPNGIIVEADINGCPNDVVEFVEELFGSYILLAEKNGLKVEFAETSDKKISILVNGEDALDIFKFEKGLHYVKDKNFTSNILISVFPQIDEKVTEVNIDPNDLKIDVYRSSGAGGQHINKTSSAVRITHLPTGIVVACQQERSQFQNKEKAMQMLKSKLVALEEQRKNESMLNERLDGIDTNKIRTYDLNNNTLTDHRIGFRIGIEQGINKLDFRKVTRKLQEVYEKAIQNIAKNEER